MGTAQSVRMRMLFGSILLCLLVVAGCAADDSEGSPAPDGGVQVSTADGGSDDPLPFMASCDVEDDRCDAEAGDSCFNFNNKGPHCTHACDSPEDCPAPSPGCNNMGVCKVP